MLVAVRTELGAPAPTYKVVVSAGVLMRRGPELAESQSSGLRRYELARGPMGMPSVDDAGRYRYVWDGRAR
jgi:hypothetical protein